MNITRAKLKETLRTIVNEESEYQSFFKSALEKAGKSIPSMSDEEKKAFFDKIDAAWDGKGEKNEALVGNQHKLDIDKDGDIGSDDLADLRAGKKVDESSKDDDYADELQKEVEKVLKGKNIKGWKLAVDNMSGTFEFQKKGIDLIIYATPMWDGNPNLPFNVVDDNGDDVDMIEKLIGNKLPFKPSYDLKKDISNYISVLTKILPKVEQAYGKLKKESVNEEKPGLWANIRAKRARGEKPAHGNSEAHKDAVAAGKKINKDESINEIEYKDAVEKFNADLMKNSQVERIAKFHKKSTKDTVKALQPYIKVLRYNDKSIKVISIDFRDTNSDVKVHVSQTYKQNESVNEAPEAKKRFMFDFYTDSNQRNTERETNFLATTLESAIKAAEHICKVTGYGYVEIYYKDLFLGSMKKKDGFKFVEGRGYNKFNSAN